MKYECTVCGYVYDEEVEGTKFEDLPDDWTCPLCGVGKDMFEKEAGDLGIHNVEDFYKTEQFKAKNRIEGKDIICKL